jgi:hypothetical protein
MLKSTHGYLTSLTSWFSMRTTPEKHDGRGIQGDCPPSKAMHQGEEVFSRGFAFGKRNNSARKPIFLQHQSRLLGQVMHLSAVGRGPHLIIGSHVKQCQRNAECPMPQHSIWGRHNCVIVPRTSILLCLAARKLCTDRGDGP